MNKISKQDYERILKYYKIKVPNSLAEMKKKAENVLADKLCKCIKKVGMHDESRAIAICTEQVINKKNIQRRKFSCKKRKSISISKSKKNRK